MEKRNSVPETADREIVISRIIQAPRELVFQVWTDPNHFSKWWGPRGFTTTTKQHEMKVGGLWVYTMHGPDGTDYPNCIRYEEIKRPERLAYEHGENPKDPPMFHATITFEAQGKHTLLTMKSVFATAQLRDLVVKQYGAIEGGNQHLDCLEEEVAKALFGGEEFVLSRTFDAPKDLVWEVYTKAEHLKHWWGPKGFTMKTTNLDLRPGGTFHYEMTGPNGMVMWGKFVYRDVAPTDRIIFVNSFSNEKGETVRHPMAPNWPLEMLNKMYLTEKNGKTTVLLRGCPINATEEERRTYKEGFKSMEAGFGGTFDQLDAYLAKVKK